MSAGHNSVTGAFFSASQLSAQVSPQAANLRTDLFFLPVRGWLLSLEFLFWSLLAAALISFWWQSDRTKQFAMDKALLACKQQDLQFLDQTMVLRGLRPVRTSEGQLVLRRRYQFEFTTTGQARYKGKVTLLGNRVSSLELEPHIMPESNKRLH